MEAAADAYVWGYPLVAVHRTLALPGQGAGRLVGRHRLSTAADRAVVGPNNDTLYSSGGFDLRAGDVTIDVDPMEPPGRYWSVMLLDAYTHVAYVSRRRYGRAGARVRVAYDPTTPPPADAAPEVVPMGTPTLWVLARVLVDGPDDLEAARAAQARIRVGQQGDAPAGPRFRHPGRRADDSHAGDLSFFDELRDALALDPPGSWHPPLSPAAAALLDDPPPGDVLADGLRAGEARIRAHGPGADRAANGWATRSRGADFGDDVTYRAAFAKYSLAGHLPAENRSYSRVIDGSRPAALRFPAGGEPPVGAFWSLSLYGPDLFFVDNELGRFSIGDRTPGLRRDADGSLAIAVGHERPPDTANWLPAPAGPCVLVLRAYEGRREIVDATWFPPDLSPR